MKTNLIRIAAAAAVLPFLVAACGGSDDNNSGDRPSAQEISDYIATESGDVAPVEFSDCIGEQLEASDLPNGVLRSLLAGEDANIDADNEDDYNQILDDVQATCTEEALGGS